MNKRNKGTRKRRGRRGNKTNRYAKRGGFGAGVNPFVGPAWNVSNDANYYALSKTGINVGGIPAYYGNIGKSFQWGGKRYKTKKSKSRSKKLKRLAPKLKYLTRRGGSPHISDLIPQPILNLSRYVRNGIRNYYPGGNVWSGVDKIQSSYPTVQQNLQT